MSIKYLLLKVYEGSRMKNGVFVNYSHSLLWQLFFDNESLKEIDINKQGEDNAKRQQETYKITFFNLSI